MAGKSREKVKAPPKSVSSLSAKKQRCAASWSRGQARKRQRQMRQDEAHARNQALRARGELTPWEQSKAAAKYRKGPAARLSPDDVTRLTALKEEGGIPVRKVKAELEAEAVSNTSSTGTPPRAGSRAGIRAAKRKGTGSGD